MFFKIAVALHLKKYPEGPGDEVDSTASAVMHFYVYLFACFSVSCFYINNAAFHKSCHDYIDAAGFWAN